MKSRLKFFISLIFISIGITFAIAKPSVQLSSVESESIHGTKARQSTTSPIAILKSTNDNRSTFRSTPLLDTDQIKHSAFLPPRHQSAFHLQAQNEHDRARRYLPQNTMITSLEQDPLSQRYAIDERTTVSQDGRLALTVWSNQKYYLKNDRIDIYARLQHQEGIVINTDFEALLIKGKQAISQISLSDHDNNGLHQASILLTDYINNPLSGVYKVLIKSRHHDIGDGIAFTLSQPDIVLTNRFQDTIDQDGNLRIEAQVSVTQTNRFYLQASLYSQAGTPIGSTQFSGELTQGMHWIPLLFTGLMLHDAQEEGPYILRQLSVAKVTMPMQRGPLQQPDYETGPYRLENFSQKNYGSQ